MNSSCSVDTLTNDVMRKALDGDHPVLESLRRQYAAATIQEVKGSGVGLFVVFGVPDALSIGKNVRFQITDVSGEVAGLKNGFGTVLFIDSGKLSSLEFYTYEEKWPEKLGPVTISYDYGARNWDRLTAALSGSASAE
jgi:hypothetical protein